MVYIYINIHNQKSLQRTMSKYGNIYYVHYDINININIDDHTHLIYRCILQINRSIIKCGSVNLCTVEHLAYAYATNKLIVII